ncbi:MAG TPA: hypothetical protein VJY35_16330 [Candidatus Eisenbacteria bacterium]|nr:hypothetical protein [Candidatus Eisenbacteria bacterium]
MEGRFARVVAWLLVAGLLAPMPGSADRIKEWNPTIIPAQFSPDITNDYFLLPVGRILRYEGPSKDGTETLEVRVTSQTKNVMGVTTRVVIETHRLNGQVVEVSENWFAQHQDGTVWYFGEFSQEYVNGVPQNSAGSWEAGVADALPGIVMKGDPQPGDTYYQEFAEGVAQDQAQVMSVTETTTVPYGTFSMVVRTKDWTALEPASREKKYFAPGVGLIIDDNVQLVSITG